MRIFDCKNPECQEIYKDAPVITDFLCEDCSTEWETLKEQLLLLSVNYVLDPRLVRGLDYYTRTVFEFTPGLGKRWEEIFAEGRIEFRRLVALNG